MCNMQKRKRTSYVEIFAVFCSPYDARNRLKLVKSHWLFCNI